MSEALNALRALARIPIERCPAGSTDDWVIFNMYDHLITVGHVRDARAALTADDKIKSQFLRNADDTRFSSGGT